MLKNNYHTHSEYCKHGNGKLEEYIKEAIKANFSELGFTCHIPFTKEFMEGSIMKSLNKPETSVIYQGRISRMDYSEVDPYLSELKYLKNKYKDKIKILSGFECEYDETNIDFVKSLRDKVDYLVLGIHHVFKNGALYDFTKRTVVEEDSIRELTYDDLDVYLESAVNGIESGLFNMIVHPDFFMEKRVEFTPKCESIARTIISKATLNNVYLEINASDYRKAFTRNRRLMYPRVEFWKLVSEYKNALIIIGSDSHEPDRVNEKYAKNAYNDIVKRFKLKLSYKMNIFH